MKTKFITILLVAFTLFSCKQEKKSADADVKKDEVSNVFQVVFELNVNIDDHFRIYYTEDGSINFNEEHCVWADIKGSPETQKVVFNLPENTIPTQIRWDLGVNKNQEDMVIKSFNMSYLGKTFEAKGPLFFKYFRPNPLSTTVIVDKGIVKNMKKGDVYVGPSFYPAVPLAEEIQKLIK